MSKVIYSAFYISITFCLVISFVTSLHAQVTEQDSLSLVELYDATDGNNWTDRTNWLTGPVSSWYGIDVVGNRVTEIDLVNNMLSGTIPDEIGNLSELKIFNVAVNQLSGPIPATLGNLSLLEQLIVSKNDLSGLVPPELGMLSNLRDLTLFDNQLEGPLPDLSALQNLTELVLGQNDFAGPFPEWVLDMPNLSFVGFRRAGLIGNLPANLFEALPNLDHLRVDNNQLEGDISVWFHGSTPMTTLEIYNNQFDGVMPDSVVDVNISSFSIGKNKIAGIPDFSAATETKSYFGIDQNDLGFHELEKAQGVTTFNASSFILGPQNALLDEETHFVKEGENVSITSGSSSEQDTYQWYKDGVEIQGATDRDFLITTYHSADAGTYHCVIANPQFEFIIERSPVTLETDITSAIKDPLQDKLKIFPNPASDQILIQADDVQSVTIFDLNGKKWIHSSQPVVHMSSLYPGVYLVRVQTTKGFVMQEFLYKI